MLDSTIWLDREAREVFITALLMATPFEVTTPTEQLEVNSLDATGWLVPPGWYGFVAAAGPGIVHRAGLDDAIGLAALERLGAPEKGSRSREFDGRRLVRVNGGYIVLNFMRYREHDYGAAQRMRKYRQRRREQTGQVEAQLRNSDGVTRNVRRIVTEAEAEAEAEAEVIPQIQNSHALDVQGKIKKPESKKVAKTKTATADAVGGKPHWVRQCAKLWQHRFGGKTIPWGEIGKHLKPLKDEPQLLERFAAYLTATKPQYVNLARFAQTFASWGNGKASPQTYSYTPGVKGPEL